MSTKKISLVGIHSNKKFTPLALLYLKSYLTEKKSYKADLINILEFDRKQSVDNIVLKIIEGKPDIVGFSCYIWNIQKVSQACIKLKQALPHITIVLGGPEVGPVSVSVLKNNPDVDVIVKSEGELVFADLVEAIHKKKSFKAVKGISYREGDRVFENEKATILKDLNHLASPHQEEFGRFEGRFVCIETQRGCVFRCSFCFYNKDYSIRNRRFHMDRVKAELLFWLNKDVSEIYLMDPIFNLNAKRAKEICRFIIENKKRDVRFHTEIWAEFVDEEMAELFYKAGFRYLEVGLQSSNSEVLSIVERRLKYAQFIQGLEYLNKYNLNVELQLIYGLPGETRESFRESILFAASLKPKSLAVFNLMILPGTELWKRAKELNIEYDPKPYYQFLRSPSLNDDDRNYAIEVIESIGVLYRSRAFQAICAEANMNLIELIDHWIHFRKQSEFGYLTKLNYEAERYAVFSFLNFLCLKNKLNLEFYKMIFKFEYPETQAEEALVFQESYRQTNL